MLLYAKCKATQETHTHGVTPPQPATLKQITQRIYISDIQISNQIPLERRRKTCQKQQNVDAAVDADVAVDVDADVVDAKTTKRKPKKVVVKKKKRKKERRKDPNAPKRAQSAYFLYMGSVRDQVRATSTECKIGDVTKHSGAMWRQLDAQT